jgi:hypothetical protein
MAAVVLPTPENLVTNQGNAPGKLHPHLMPSMSSPAEIADLLDESPPARSGGRAVVHYQGGRPAPKRTHDRRPRAQFGYTGHGAIEPTIGVNDDGDVFMTGSALDPMGLAQPHVVMTPDEGRTWKDVSPSTHLNTLDPFLYLDRDTGRVFSADLSHEVTCSTLSFSDDKGASWTTTKACGLADHQNVFSGPPPPAGPNPIGYPNIVYYCAIDGGALAYFGTATSCLKSLDGGLTWTRTGQPAFQDPGPGDRGDLGIQGHCGGGTGHGYADHRGNIYLPRSWCGIPYLAISRDEGMTWERVQVADTLMGFWEELGVWEHEASVAVDRDGNIYYGFVDDRRLPLLVVSRDGGKTWGEPMMIGPPGIKEAWGVKLEVGRPGRVAVAYVGSTNAPGGKGAQGTDCATFELPPSPGCEGEAKKYDTDVTWNGYITMSGNALAKDPVFYTGSLNDEADPIVRGACPLVQCGPQIDFIDIAIGPDGTPWASMVDGCPPGKKECDESLGFVGRLVGGLRLR